MPGMPNLDKGKVGIYLFVNSAFAEIKNRIKGAGNGIFEPMGVFELLTRRGMQPLVMRGAGISHYGSIVLCKPAMAQIARGGTLYQIAADI
jgi:hypothetical protein